MSEKDNNYQQSPIQPGQYADFLEIHSKVSETLHTHLPTLLPLLPQQIKILPDDEYRRVVKERTKARTHPFFLSVLENAAKRKGIQMEYLMEGSEVWSDFDTKELFIAEHNLQALADNRKIGLFAIGTALLYATINFSVNPIAHEASQLNDIFIYNLLSKLNTDPSMNGILLPKDEQELISFGFSHGVLLESRGALTLVTVDGKSYSPEFGMVAHEAVSNYLLREPREEYSKLIVRDLSLSSEEARQLFVITGSSGVGLAIPQDEVQNVVGKVIDQLRGLGINGRNALLKAYLNSEISQKSIEKLLSKD